jgi:hypothetical protein
MGLLLLLVRFNRGYLGLFLCFWRRSLLKEEVIHKLKELSLRSLGLVF